MSLSHRTKRLIACALAGWISGAALAAFTLPVHAAEPASQAVAGR